MAEDSDLEKTEPASSRRIEKARDEGDVPRSRELATCSVLLASGLGLWMMGHKIDDALKVNLSAGLSFDHQSAFDTSYLLTRISASILDLILAFAPLAALILLVGAFSPALMGGWIFSAKSLQPKFSRLNPIQGLGNLFSKNSLVELVKAIFKALLVGSVAYIVVSKDLEPILSLSQLPLHDGIHQVNLLLIKGFLSIVGALVLIAALDVPYQLKHYADKLKMTREEVRQESKESEGNPEVKGRIRQQQREMAKRRMMSEIPNADVVITNPTHYAVAIKYSGTDMRAPIVVAKGIDVLALKIREIASDNHLPLLESPKLARALYAHTELGDEIPEALYMAVAEVLAYVFQLRSYKTGEGEYPELKNKMEVPDELDPLYVETNKTSALEVTPA